MSDAEAGTKIAPSTTVGAVHLTVADLDRSLDYYARAIGLRARERGNGSAFLGAGGDDLLVLHEEPGARPVHGHSGLFHYALLLPERADLARWLVHAAGEHVALTGMSDHLVSEAIYLQDPDGHGIEIYRDRPRSEWEWDGDRVRMATLPLDAKALVEVLEDAAPAFPGLPAGTRMGHVHLHVADVPEAEAFYNGTLGFDVVARYGADATFMSAGGYHHHMGANVWAGRGVTPPPAGSAALRHATILLPDAAEVDRVAARVANAGQEPAQTEDGTLVRDPSGNALVLTSNGS
ncbi:MAG: catechol 2,3-dioxygenase [Solirubrobacteraceae bacterium]|nr:catechol 2,3-dioxygenase [Solirubrobacteraceae bacterium]